MLRPLSVTNLTLLAMTLGLGGACTRTVSHRSPQDPAAEPTGDDDDDDDDSSATKKKSKTTGDEDPDDTGTKKKPAKTVVPPVVVDELTHGTGGAKGQSELKSTGGLSYLIDAPEDNAPQGKSHGLLVLLHGSSASNYREFIGQMQDVAAKEGLILVSVLAPNGSGWNEGGEQSAADKLHQLVQQDLYPKYNVDKKRVLFSGQSSGGGFLASDFVPRHAQDYKGGVFLLCGAQPPSVTFTPDEATKKNFRMHFEITTGDPIWPRLYAQAVKVYGDSGMQLSKDQSKPGGHCNFDQQQVIEAHLDFVLGRSN